MGYTLVTSFDKLSYEKLNYLLEHQNANKIPFDKKCNREEANKILKYHMTLVHWGKQNDEKKLPQINKIIFTPFKIIVNRTLIVPGAYGSFMLRFSVSPGKGFPAMKNHIQNIMNLNLSSPLHITLAVSDDSLYLTKLKKIIDQEYTYPFEIPVTGLDLYHIWKPVILKKHIS